MPASKLQRVSNEQITEWVENPVTIKAKEEVEAEIARILDTPAVECLYHGEPQRTQENLVELETKAWAWKTLLDVLEGDWSYFEGENDEQ